MTATFAAAKPMLAETSSTSRAWLWPAAVVLVVLVVGLRAIDGLPVGVFFDDGMYVILAKSLATGHGYRWLQIPGTPAAIHFPPGYPALLAMLWKLFPSFPGNVIVFKIVNVFCLAGAALGTAVFARRRFAFTPSAAAAIAVATAVGIPTLVLAVQVMSEPLFLALLLPTLLAAEQILERDARPHEVVLLGLAVGALTLVRSHGIAVAAAVGILFCWKRRFRDAVLFGAATIVVMLPWQLFSAAHHGDLPTALGGNYQSYTTWLIDGFRHFGPGLAVRTVAKTSTTIGLMFGVFTAPVLSYRFQQIAMVAVLALMALGVPRMWRRAPATTLFLAFYLTIVLLWPFTPERFVWGVWPLVCLPIVLGAAVIVRWRPTDARARTLRVAGLACASVLAFGYARYTVRGYRGHWWMSAAGRSALVAQPIVRWVRERTAPNEVIASNLEPVLYLYAGRQSVPEAAFEVGDYFTPQSVAQRRAALTAILAAYHVGAIAVLDGAPLFPAAQQMASGPSPILTVRDTIANGVIFSPVSQWHP